MIKRELNFTQMRNNTKAGDDSDMKNALPRVLKNSTSLIEGRLLVTDEELAYFTVINTWGLGQCVTILGLIVNSLNVVTFIKQGVKDSVNISLLGLTISDLGSLVFHFLVNLCWTPPLVKLDLPFYPQQIMYFFVWAHILFTRVTTGTTAWITFERCVCIVAPLRVKSIITPKRTVMFISVLYVIMTAAAAPMFYTTKLTWMFDARRNKSVIGVTKIANRAEIENVAFWLNNLIPTSFFILIVIFTTVLVKALRENSKWRQQTASASKGNEISNRDTKVSKLVLIISAVFISCYFPGAVVFLFILAFPSITFTGKQRNFVIGTFSILIHLEGINASVNFFIYLGMSSKFKATLKELLCLRKGTENTNVVVRITSIEDSNNKLKLGSKTKAGVLGKRKRSVLKFISDKTQFK